MNEDSLKFDLLADMAVFSEQTGNKLVISTANGIYFGNILLDRTEEKYKSINEFMKYRKKYKTVDNENSNTNTVLLVDVTLLTPTKQIFKMPFIYLFADQIIGVSCGQLPHQKEE